MEIKVFKDVTKRESVSGGLTISQIFFVVSIVLFLIVDIVNAFYQFLPSAMTKLIFFPLLGVLACNALFRPHGMKFSTWLKLYIKFQTTIQTRTYQIEDERMKIYEPKDFKKGKKVKEAQTNKTQNN